MMLFKKNKLVLIAALSAFALRAFADPASSVPAAPVMQAVLAASAPSATPPGPWVPQSTSAASAPTASAIPAWPQNVTVVTDPPKRIKKRRKEVVPGLGSVAVNDKLTHASVVRVSRDGTEIALISNKFPNRISTPFEHPRIIDESAVSYTVDGSDIYLVYHSDKPIAIFIKGDVGDPVASVTLIPKDIPTQTIVLQLDEKNSATAVRTAKVDSYEQQITELLRTVAAGKVPDGFSEGRMATILGQKGDLSIIPEVRYSGAYLDIYRYKVENNGSQVELSESSFYQKGIRAASIFPRAVLRRGETTWIYLIADKSVLDGNGNE